MYLIKDVDIITEDNILKGYDIKFTSKIIDIKKEIEKEDKFKIIDGKNHYLCPGFVDIHLHGSFGIDIMNADKAAIKELSDRLVKTGTTSFLPTVMTSSLENMESAIQNIKAAIKDNNRSIKGINLEGPFLNPDKAGAQDKRYMKEINLNIFEKYNNIIKIVTVAPEVKGATALIKKLNELDIISSLGHTNASYKESIEGFENGISLVTHLFNGMKGIHHREIGAAGAALIEDISTELIVDGIHVSPPMLKLVFKTKDLDQIILISDAQPAALYDGEEIEFNNRKVIIKDGSARYEDGTLAGSVLSMLKAVKNMMNFSDFELPEIIKMATLNPAKKIGLNSEIGLIDIDRKADLLLLNRNLDIINVFKEGEKIK